LIACTLFVAGCAAPKAPEPPKPVRFAVITAPRVGAGADADLSAEDALLEAVTDLSGETDLAFCLVPGPLFGAEGEDTRSGLVGALGSLAIPVTFAPAPGETLGDELKALRKQTGGARQERLSPVGLSASGDVVGDAKGLVVAAQGGQPPKSPVWLLARVGSAVRFEAAPEGGVILELPSLASPPHLFGVLTVSGTELALELRSATGQAPPAPPPLAIKTPQPR
jgi:hypothetical protein